MQQGVKTLYHVHHLLPEEFPPSENLGSTAIPHLRAHEGHLQYAGQLYALEDEHEEHHVQGYPKVFSVSNLKTAKSADGGS
eukprot:6490428-Amphidinium_carterae.1